MKTDDSVKLVYFCENCKIYVETKTPHPHCGFCGCELIKSSYEN